MRVKAATTLSVAMLCATGFLVGSQVGHSAPKPSPCTTHTITLTLGFNGKRYLIEDVKVCKNGEIFLAGRQLRCRQSGLKQRKVGAGVVWTSSTDCR